MAAASDTQEPTMAEGGLQCVMGREKQNVVPQEEGRDVPHASGSPYMTERPSDELPRSATKPALRPRIRIETSPPGVVKAPIRQDDKDPFNLQEDHNQWTGEAQNPDQYSEETEACQITSIFQMMGFQTLMSPVKIKTSTSVENQGSPESSESKKSVLVASVRTNGKDPLFSAVKAIRSNDWSVRQDTVFQDTSSPHTARPSISKNIYSEGTVVNDKKSDIKLKNEEEIHTHKVETEENIKPLLLDKEDLGGLQGDSDYTDWDDPLTGVPCHFNREDPLPEVSSHFDRDDPIPGVLDHFVWDDPCGNSHDYLDWDDPPGDSLSIQYNMSLAEATGAPLRHSRVNSIEP